MLSRTNGWTTLAALAPLALAAAIALACPAQAQTESVLYSFAGGATDGSAPEHGVVTDSTGAFYGTTYFGGASGNGTIFKVALHKTGFSERVLYQFTGGADGSRPNSGLALTKDGTFYGVTIFGGANGAGAVYRLTRGRKGFKEEVLYSFTGTSDGGQPVGTPLVVGNGIIVGATTVGGSSGEGAVFELTPTHPGYSESVLYSFPGVSNAGYDPQAGLVMGPDGSLIGTTSKGGGGTGCESAGCGTVYELFKSRGVLKEKTLYVFAGGTTDGSTPVAPVTIDSLTGSIFGTTEFGGTKNDGTVFMLTPQSGRKYTETVLYSFTATTDGQWPLGPLLLSKGDLYGTTTQAGSGCTLTGCGTVFELKHSSGQFTFNTLYPFAGPPDGAEPASTSLIMDSSGALYGTTHSGGSQTTCTNGGTADGCGIVFKIAP